MDVLLGLQYGDEGKGKIVDLISANYDIVARFAGGCNAGHTLNFNGKKHVLHLIPSGIFHDCMNVIGNGCVIDPVNLMKEIEKLEEMGIDVKSKLLISSKAHITCLHHKLRDKELEEEKGDKKIGSTLKGIGPTYTSKVGREGIRMCDINKFTLYDDTAEWVEFSEAIKKLSQYQIVDTEVYLNESIRRNKKILAEGAQGSLLDIDFGTYPYVTSSNTCIGGVMTGLGIPPQSINNVIGITKAYCTRVGSGPFLTEELSEIGEKIRQVGGEFGSTTGRPRRCGWLNLEELKYSCMINGVNTLCLMKLDVLSSFDKIQVLIGHDAISNEPLVKEFDGWNEDISKIKNYEDLHENCKIFVNFVSEFMGIDINIISVGPDREETINYDIHTAQIVNIEAH